MPSTTLKALHIQFQDTLKDQYPYEEIRSFFLKLVSSYLGISRLEWALEPDVDVASSTVIKFNKALERLKNEEPIQYILGETEFYGLIFKVTTDVLIPRPETEELIAWILDCYTANGRQTNNSQINILDIGTGSGCIAITLAKHLPKAKVYALDISEQALALATYNAKMHQVAVECIHADILSVSCSKTYQNIFNTVESFDIIVSNPPYVRELEKAEMHSNVLHNEPHLALFVSDDNPLIFYKAITTIAVHKLKQNGQLFFEINQYLGKAMISLLADFGFHTIRLKKDMFGNDRMIKGKR